jgi:hypothetical protein
MVYNPVPLVSTGDLWTATNHNTYIKDNFAAGVPDIFTTKGDIAVATGADVAVRMAAGANGLFLMADSAQANGLIYRACPVVLSKTHTSWDGDAPAAGTYGQTPAGWGYDTVSPLPKWLIIALEAVWSTQNNGQYVFIRPPSSGAVPQLMVRSSTANISQQGFGIVPLDSSGNWDIVVGGSNLTAVYVRICGYF